VIIDSSALVAIARNEPEAEALEGAMERSPRVSVSAATLLETSLVLRDPHGQAFVDAMATGLRVVPFDRQQLAVARAAQQRFGRGTGHPARLNFGDCLSYALAITTGEPLLFTGDDFGHTDVIPAYLPD
jgi:ribonuclease VapC